MGTLYTRVNNMDVWYTEGLSGTDVEVKVDGQVQQTRQDTWFMGHLLERALELEAENYELKKKLDNAKQVGK